MPRPRSTLVHEVKTKLIERLREGFYGPGARFFSNRAIARRFGVSYQTAHRLVGELVTEGWLERRPAAGTFVAGSREIWRGVELVFAARARRPGSFGARLLAILGAALDRAGVPFRVRWGGGARSAVHLPRDWYPILWEEPVLAGVLAAERRYVLVLEDRPVRGIAASYADSVSVDDYSGGMAAAEWLRARAGAENLAVLAGPPEDSRSRLRVEGFLSVLPHTRVVSAESWFYERALRVAPKVLNCRGVFCANDRLAAAVVIVARKRGLSALEVIGFDDAPISEELNFSTIAIPWEEIAGAAVEVVKRRMAGDQRTAAGVIYAPRPLGRRSSRTESA